MALRLSVSLINHPTTAGYGLRESVREREREREREAQTEQIKE
jgi:hypothetical protein